MERQWRIEMLGWLRATRADRVIGRFRSRKAGSLLAYLAYHHHRSYPREVLIELLWPESSWRAGRTNLRTELTWLRHRLEPPEVPAGAVLLAHGDTLQLNPESCVSDVATFEVALQSAADAGSRAEQVRWLDEAVRLYQGELLPGYFDPWLMPERLRLTDAFLQAVHQLVAEREQAGELHSALQAAWRGAAVDPLREATHSDLVRLLMSTGQPEAARRQVQERDRLLGAGRAEAADLIAGSRPGAHQRTAEQNLKVRAAETEILRQQLAARTAEVEELYQQLLSEKAEKRKLRQELAVRTAEAEELWRQWAPARPNPRPEEWG
jgi:DNA-binding SARP family transcriptional activator